MTFGGSTNVKGELRTVQAILGNGIKKNILISVLHLQASNTALQKQVAGEKETKVKLALELKDLHSQIQHMKIERNKLLAALSEKVRASVS